MRFKALGIAALAATTLIGAIAATPADARWGHRGGWHGGWGWRGPAIGAGLAFGALAAAPYAYGYYGCPRRIVGYTPWGHPIVRRVCY